MKLLTEIFRDPGLNTHGKTDHRAAVRAVTLREGKLLMVYSPVNGDYKFPGGGVDESENHEVALKREIAEECGMNMMRILDSIGCIVEYAIPMKAGFDVFKMTSSYYLCEVDAAIGTQHLDAYEEDLGFQPAWVDINAAIQTNKAILQSNAKAARMDGQGSFHIGIHSGELALGFQRLEALPQCLVRLPDDHESFGVGFVDYRFQKGHFRSGDHTIQHRTLRAGVSTSGRHSRYAARHVLQNAL